MIRPRISADTRGSEKSLNRFFFVLIRVHPRQSAANSLPMPVIPIDTLDDPRVAHYRNLKDRELERRGRRFIRPLNSRSSPSSPTTSSGCAGVFSRLNSSPRSVRA